MLGVTTDNLHPQRNFLGCIIFGFGCLIIYLLFYGTALTWTASKPIQDLLGRHGVWNDLQAKLNVPDALALLTQCLQRSVPRGFATVDDFSTCLKSIGVVSGQNIYRPTSGNL